MRNEKYIKQNIEKPKEYSLMKLGSEFIKKNKCPYQCNENEELIGQVPHWVFPLAGSLSVDVLRTLLFIGNHKRYLKNLNKQ